MGKPQGIPFFIKCLEHLKEVYEAFLVVGNGMGYGLLERYAKSRDHKNFKLMKSLPKDDYDILVAFCNDLPNCLSAKIEIRRQKYKYEYTL